MKQLKTLILILLVLAAWTAEAKTYTSKAARPTVSDHTWKGHDYSFNLDENGMLTGTNTFAIVYNTTPPRSYNKAYVSYKKTCITGSETLTITVLPGDFNYIYTLKSDIAIWDWDSHEHKWAKRNPVPYNGTRTFHVKDGIVDGKFEFPIKTLLPDVYMIYGEASGGMVPSNGKIGWKCYDSAKSSVTSIDDEIVPVGNKTILNVGTYLADVLGQRSIGMKYEDSENGTLALLPFPITDPTILGLCGRDAGVGESLEHYAYIGLPDFYYDDYVDPYEPVEKMLPNGHKLVSTLLREGGLKEVEYWESNGYSYKQEKSSDDRSPIIGERIAGDTTYVHVDDKQGNFEEKGFSVNGKYYMTYNKNVYTTTSIDWTPMSQEGYFIISHNGERRYAVKGHDSSKHTFSSEPIYSNLYNTEYSANVFKIIGNDGSKTVCASNTDELTEQVKSFLKMVAHPYLINLFKFRYPDVDPKFVPLEIKAVNIRADGVLSSTLSDSEYEVNRRSGRERIVYVENLKKWNAFIDALNRSGENPLDEIASLISMELELPDYDVTKVDEKVVGKRTGKLLKTLCRLLKQKSKLQNNVDSKGRAYSTYFPNNAKKYFTHENRLTNYKSVEISRVVKKGNKISVHVLTKDNNSKTSETVLNLEDNIPIDEYAEVWKSVAVNL